MDSISQLTIRCKTMNSKKRMCLMIALACFILAAFPVIVGPIALVPLGLAFMVLGSLV